MQEFKIQQNIKYTFHPDGFLNTKYEITLTNQTALLYAKEYQITIEGMDLSSVFASDEGGNIFKSSSKNNQKTTLFLEFNKPSLGKGQVKQFSLSYNQPSQVKNNGQVKEITLPSLSNPYPETQTNIQIEVPQSWGTIAHSSNGKNSLSYQDDNQQIPKTTFSFGQAQILEFSLDYYPPENHKGELVVPIPPDTPEQTILLSSINPQPENVTTTSDGNWLATFLPSSNQKITVSGLAQISPNSTYQHNTNPDYLSANMATNELWPTLNTKLKTPKEIYQHVLDNLNYNYQRANNPQPQTLEQALKNPNNSICIDFTNYFISLTRSNQIPSRQVIGYAVSQNQTIRPINKNADILHTWPQYFDISKKIWKDVDPTWEKTTGGVDYFNNLGLNHLAFTILGKDTNIKPPGSYRSLNQKSVQVDFSKKSFVTTSYPLTHKLVYKNLIIPQIITKNPNLNSYQGLPPLSHTSEPHSIFTLLLPHKILNLRLSVLLLALILLIITLIVILKRYYEKDSTNNPL